MIEVDAREGFPIEFVRSVAKGADPVITIRISSNGRNGVFHHGICLSEAGEFPVVVLLEELIKSIVCSKINMLVVLNVKAANVLVVECNFVQYIVEFPT